MSSDISLKWGGILLGGCCEKLSSPASFQAGLLVITVHWKMTFLRPWEPRNKNHTDTEPSHTPLDTKEYLKMLFDLTVSRVYLICM